MAFHRDPDAGRKATAWLAVAFTLTTGAAVCSFIILAFAEDAKQGFFVLGGILAGILLLLWGMSSPRDRSEPRDWLVFWRKTQEQPDPAELYQPRKRRLKRSPLGSNQPPTLESIREIAQTHARWVPHGPVPRRERPDR
jgi:hypothetical protein